MYGYDVLVDANLKPWLIEVNASPSLTDTTVEDKVLKKALINDVFNIVMPADWLKTRSNVGTDTCKEQKVGSFEVLFDETANKQKATALGNTKKPSSALTQSKLSQVAKLLGKNPPIFR